MCVCTVTDVQKTPWRWFHDSAKTETITAYTMLNYKVNISGGEWQCGVKGGRK